MDMTIARLTRYTRMATAGVLLALVCLYAMSADVPGRTKSAIAAPTATAAYQGVASCAGSTCHGRMVGDGKAVRQDELARWQEPSTPGGAHSRAFAVLAGARGRQIAATLGLGDPMRAKECLGCHASPTAGSQGARFRIEDGVGCETCHGPSGGWIASHYAAGASHAANIAAGMIPLERPQARAAVCLDCHYGSAHAGQFVSHGMMAAGHPRISFELDLFSTLQAHHAEDGDYIARKGRSDGVALWAVGQAMALERALTLYAGPRGTQGVFPEFTFFDCHSCHRRIYDQSDRMMTWEVNPGRQIPAGMPPFNDENAILLLAAAKVVAPALAARLDNDSRIFHAALALDRPAAAAAALRLAGTARMLADALANARGDMAFAITDQIAGSAIGPRFTDYAGSAQAVMAVDTLLNALVRSGRVTVGAAAGIRGDINRAYAAVRDPNGYRPSDFRAALGRATQAIGALR